MAASKEFVSINAASRFNITECPICFEPFKKPKALPCLHTFCLECLEKYGEDEVPEAKLPCPFCRQEFIIPKDGFKNLPGNFFIEQLSEERKSIRGTLGHGDHDACEICENKDKPVTKHCVDCGQNACDDCVKVHNGIRATRNHKVVLIAEIAKHQTLMKSRPTYCEEHPDKPLELYCYDCKTPICLMCSAVKHKTHHCEEINESARKFSQDLQNCFPQLMDCIEAVQVEVSEQDKDKKELLTKISDTESRVNSAYDQLLKVIESQRSDLLKKLDSFKTERLKAMQTRADECARQSAIMESFKKYIEELIEHGSACDVSRSVNHLLARSEELIRSQQSFNAGRLMKDRVDFTPANIPDITSGRTLMIGQLRFNGKQENCYNEHSFKV